MSKAEHIASILLFVTGFVIVIDTILEQFFNIGTKQNNLVIGYCIAFIMLSINFPNLLKKKIVIIPMYIMIIQMFFSLFSTYIF
tara:strand:+ start:467 stop:718 length:252 start_codon:yes stop_codon:yes gene_type:complete